MENHTPRGHVASHCFSLLASKRAAVAFVCLSPSSAALSCFSFPWWAASLRAFCCFSFRLVRVTLAVKQAAHLVLIRKNDGQLQLVRRGDCSGTSWCFPTS